MKSLTLLLATLLTFSMAYADETLIRIGNHNVNLIKEQSPDSPKTCHAALLEKIKKQGWHDEIYNSAADEKAYLVFSQRIIDKGVLSRMRITFWKAGKGADGMTNVEEQVFLLDRTELDSFLDVEIKPLFLKFSRAL
jgi:hypothetical protein